MSVKLKNKYLYLILVISIGICLGLFYIFITAENKQEESFIPSVDLAEEGNQEKPEENSDESTLAIDLVEYQTFDLEEVDFKFIVAKIRVKSEDEINLSLDGFKTSEGIVLSEIENYVDALEEQGLFLGKLNVWYEILSQESSMITNIFIPVDDSAETVTLSFDFNDHSIDFDLKDSIKDSSSLRYNPDDVIFDGRSYQMRVSSAYELSGETINRTYENGYSEVYLSPSTAQIHAFNIEVVSLWGDEVVIEEAIYTVSETGEEFKAFNEQFTTEKSSNLINKTITDTDQGVVFIETLNPSENPITYQGVLRLKVKGQEHYIVINVDL